MINAAVGTCRDFTFDYEKIRLGSDLSVTDFNGVVSFSRTQQGLLAQGEFSARMTLECVRCLTGYAQPLTWTFTDMFAFDQRSITESNLLVPEEGRIDLAPLMREYALLEVPIQPLCQPDCKGLCPECGENLNQVNCGHRSGGDESPFAALKDLLE
jgi:uncharacterized protein